MFCVLLILGWRVFSFLIAYIDKKFAIHLVYYVFICIFDFKKVEDRLHLGKIQK